MNDILGLLVSPQAEEHGLTKLVVASPLRKLDLGDQYRFDPVAALHDGWGDALAPSPSSFLWEVNKRASPAFDILQCTIQVRQ
jgi:hypothetical protein